MLNNLRNFGKYFKSDSFQNSHRKIEQIIAAINIKQRSVVCISFYAGNLLLKIIRNVKVLNFS